MTLENLIYKKCPFCDFTNIYEDTIAHHIRYTDDERHTGVDNGRLIYPIVEKQKSATPWRPHITKEDIKLPWIKCLWCSYHDKIEFDLSLHFLEEHDNELLAIPITRRERLAAKALIRDPRARFFAKFESPMEYRLDKAIEMAKRQGDKQYV